jgi:hypothetical protein
MRTVLAATLLLATSPVLAGQHWLGPTDYSPAPQEEVDVLQVNGRDFAGKPAARRDTEIRNVWIRDAETRDVTSAGSDGAPALTRLTNGEDRGTLVAWRSTVSRQQWDATPFHEYVVHEGLDDCRRQRDLFGATWPAKEVSEREGKTWISGAEDWRHRKPIGLPLEIIPRRDPAIVENLEVEVLWQGKPLPNALLRTWRQNLLEGGLPQDPATRLTEPSVELIRTDRYGRARLDTDARGEYLVACMHAVPSQNRDDWERTWETYATSLTFARGAHYKDDDGDWPRGWRSSHGEDPGCEAYRPATPKTGPNTLGR